MAYASKAGRAKVSATSPQALAVCDRCGRWYNFVDLSWQYDWRGSALQNLRILVCRPCYDTPQEQLRAIVVPQDPVPIVNARVEYFLQDETALPGPPSVIGQPVGLDQNAVMPFGPVNGQLVQYRLPVPALTVLANGTALITVNCSSPHNFATNDQITVEGLSVAEANGFYSVVVTTATQFTYTTYAAVAAGSLLTPNTLMINCLIGLPYTTTTIPQVGP